MTPVSAPPTVLHGQLAHYVIVRADLPFGLQVANVAHAAGESAPARIPHGTIAVVLAARDEPHLRELADRLEAAGHPIARVVEDARPYRGQLMAVGIEPTRDRGALGKVVSSLPLVK